MKLFYSLALLCLLACYGCNSTPKINTEKLTKSKDSLQRITKEINISHRLSALNFNDYLDTIEYSSQFDNLIGVKLYSHDYKVSDMLNHNQIIKVTTGDINPSTMTLTVDSGLVGDIKTITAKDENIVFKIRAVEKTGTTDDLQNHFSITGTLLNITK